MKSQALNNKMKVFETAMDHIIAPEMYIVARLDSRGLTEQPLQAMIETTEHLMTCGFNITYAYTERREISLLFDINENSYERKANSFVSILAAEASAKLTQVTGEISTFDSRVIALPNKGLAIDYFRSRVSNSQSSSWSYWKGTRTSIRELITVKSGEMIADLMSTD